MKKLILYTTLFTLCFGCKKDEFLGKGDYYFLKNDGAVMPVWVRGNIESGTFIITLHGGPGASAHEFVTSKAFKKLEEKYAVVYWDQRFAGIAQENTHHKPICGRYRPLHPTDPRIISPQKHIPVGA